ncbi:probable RNA-directed DNA polymerase from transposon X-element isoform X1 [Topomyia yanbarensis]|uniref:probable RNA-directed DNA polymerase from transposon X-element isoform X1 n=1 Tax=Topomyia yanbarensis TaxID=2498891 RepID=UPI00273B845C|nr:probable RNA-directed DNA polymerase from transposon X-element isoform X1 [Topomyia yanbarensis]XP_058821165.1 probable RNA-directed DNA polymerase from transposon X-element isoform X1 [Topomyia yanbarensis]XP_058821166.1 probable RNA-directed DNA polymerase from transposon X-element isoform X1 [Topomyia yanbarensis]
MRNRNVTNESEDFSNRWIFNFAKKICPDSAPAQKIIRDAPTSNDFIDSPLTMMEFSIALLSCNNNAPGLDRIKFNLVKNLPDLAKRRLLNLFNKLLEQNIVPHDWRQVRVIAISKPGKLASDHNSYRPIAMLSCIRKLLEKMILRRLDNWVEANGLLSDTQFGFRRGKGTNDCLALLSSEIQLAYAKKEQMASVFLDIKGAFDSVSIDVLSEKLHQCGLSPILNNYLYNLLSEKHMHFSYGDLATLRTSYMGLPQGSCLSPLLYNLYVNDIDNCIVSPCTLRQLADDGVVSATGPKAINLQQPLQDSLDNLSIWALKLGIDFSTEKTELVVFSRKRDPAQLQLQLVGRTIAQVLTFKYLGIWFDSKGTWGGHIRYLITKCQQRINFLRTITGSWWGSHPSDMIRLYQTTILSVMEYGCICFRSAANTHIINLERIQYRCLRIALGCMQSTHTMSLEVLAGVLPLKDRFWDLSSRLLIRCEVMNPLVIENFERLVELQPQTRFMTMYFNHMSQEITPARYVPTYVNILDTPKSTLFFDTSMQAEIRGIPDHLRSREIPKIFTSKYQHIDS